MSARLVERALWLAAALGVGVAVREWGAMDRDVTPLGQEMAPAADPSLFDPESLSVAAERVSAMDLFRVERARNEQAPESAHESPSATRAPVPRPGFLLRGIVGGPPWDIVLDGVPGRPAGTVIRDGETVAGYSIRVASRDTVQVRGADTTWILVLKR